MPVCSPDVLALDAERRWVLVLVNLLVEMVFSLPEPVHHLLVEIFHVPDALVADINYRHVLCVVFCFRHAHVLLYTPPRWACSKPSVWSLRRSAMRAHTLCCS